VVADGAEVAAREHHIHDLVIGRGTLSSDRDRTQLCPASAAFAQDAVGIAMHLGSPAGEADAVITGCAKGGDLVIYWRYCWIRVVRSPARPCRSIEYCQARNSSTVSVYRLQASSSESRPPRTAATTSALRRITQRFVPGAGRSAMVSGLPSGPMTYFTLGRWGSVILLSRTLETKPKQQHAIYAGRLKIWLSATRQIETPAHHNLCVSSPHRGTLTAPAAASP